MNGLFNLLVVDDNQDLAHNLQETLEMEGYAVSMACDGKSALVLCETASFDLALVDFKLPDMDGLRLQEELARRTDADVIIITGYGTLENAVPNPSSKPMIWNTRPAGSSISARTLSAPPPGMWPCSPKTAGPMTCCSWKAGGGCAPSIRICPCRCGGSGTKPMNPAGWSTTTISPTAHG
ncbi:MAG: response regulator, partial [Thermodesulfobacteriota bacterium]